MLCFHDSALSCGVVAVLAAVVLLELQFLHLCTSNCGPRQQWGSCQFSRILVAFRCYCSSPKKILVSCIVDLCC